MPTGSLHVKVTIDSLQESGTETRNEKDVSNAINNLFCTIGRDLADEIQPADIEVLCPPLIGTLFFILHKT